MSGLMPVFAVIVGVFLVLGAGSAGGAAKAPSGQGDDRVPTQVYGGVPLSTREDSAYVFIDNESFDIGYSEYRQNPVWVGYYVGPSLVPGRFKRPRTFQTDRRTVSKVGHRDYTRSGYDRGHMAPNHAIATRYGAGGQAETFRMSNIVPQKPDLNRQVWRRIEEMEADRWAVDLDGVWVITGPVFDEDRQFLKKAAPRIDIPDAFYKVIVDEVVADESGAPVPRMLAFMVPQDVDGGEPVEEFLVSVDWIESKTGLDLMPGLPDEVEAALESAVPDALW